VGQEESLLFSSGYAANVGLISSLPQRGDTVFSDACNHASIIDGCRLSAAETTVYPHLDLSALAVLLRERRPGGHSFIVTESYFSMDADSPDLSELRAMANQHDAALIVDEAHAIGIFGPLGAGLSAQHAVAPDIVVGTLGKAVGLQGAFVAGPRIVRSWLWNRARSFVYSTATMPTLARQTLLHVKHIQANDGARARLMRHAEQIRTAVAELGLAVPPDSHGPIIPVLLGSVERALDAAQAFRAKGILAYPIRPPTVPKDSARLRLTVTASMSDAAFAHLLDALPQCLRPESLA
jgi:8-amino-7-oxononanoate synthase